jgi:hypothetical protein
MMLIQIARFWIQGVFLIIFLKVNSSYGQKQLQSSFQGPSIQRNPSTQNSSTQNSSSKGGPSSQNPSLQRLPVQDFHSQILARLFYQISYGENTFGYSEARSVIPFSLLYQIGPRNFGGEYFKQNYSLDGNSTLVVKSYLEVYQFFFEHLLLEESFGQIFVGSGIGLAKTRSETQFFGVKVSKDSLSHFYGSLYTSWHYVINSHFSLVGSVLLQTSSLLKPNVQMAIRGGLQVGF